MDLSVGSTGLVLGKYSSTTGASGVYLVIGSCKPVAPSSGLGQNLVLSIFWRPVDQQTYNTTWHWVSTYCGQLQANGVITLINSLVATTEYSGSLPGDYIGQLEFTRASDSCADVGFALPAAGDIAASDNPIVGQWSNASGDISLAVAVADTDLGLAWGELNYQQQTVTMWGFTDTHAGQQPLQSLSLSGYMTVSSLAISLSGSLAVAASQLNLSRWLAISTAPGDAYMQANTESWILTKKIKE
jgi:hypothetical protein